jgi:hypothetical protein
MKLPQIEKGESVAIKKDSYSREALQLAKQKGLKQLRRNATATLIYTIIVISGNVLVPLSNLSSANGIWERFSAYFSLGVVLFAALWFAKLYAEARTTLQRRNNAVPCPPDVMGQIVSALQVFSEAEGVDLNRISFFVNKQKLRGGPNVRWTKTGFEMELPLSFLKVIASDRDAAIATLKHELAHVAHKDTKRWAFTSVFWHVLTRTALPLSIANIIITAILFGLSYANAQSAQIQVAQAKQDLDAEYARQLSAIRQTVKDKFQREVAESMLSLKRSTAESEIESKVPDFDSGFAVIMLLLTALPLLLLFWLLRSLRKDRWLTERMADLEVMLCGEGPALLRALRFLSRVDAKITLFSLHPSLSAREKFILAGSDVSPLGSGAAGN